MARSRKDPRHRAREAALQILYQWEIGRADVTSAANTFFTLQWPNEDPPDSELRAFASSLARDTVERLDQVDPLIAALGSIAPCPSAHGVCRRTRRRVKLYQ